MIFTFDKLACNRRCWLVYFLLIVSMSAYGNQDWESSNDKWGYSETYISYLTGDGYQEFSQQNFGIVESSKQIMTFEHASSFILGDQFFFFDVNLLEEDTYLYGEWHPRLSFNKTFGKDFSFWFVKDIYLAHEQDYGEDFKRYFYGMSIDIDIPHASYFTLSMLVGGDPDVEGDSTEYTMAWSFPFSLGSWNFKFLGYVDFLTAENDFMSDQVQAQPQLLVDIGDVFGNPEVFFAGVEYQYWDNKYGVEGVNESLVQFMVTWLL